MSSVQVELWQQGSRSTAQDQLAEEMPLSIRYNGEPFAVMMGTPRDLEDYALGFSLTEGIIGSADELESADVIPGDESYTLCLRIPEARAAALDRMVRNLPGRSGCGLCGVVEADFLGSELPQVPAGNQLRSESLQAALGNIATGQTLNATTGAVHAAAWVDLDGNIQLLREDVGRHNALDKLYGAMARSGIDKNRGFVLVTSRASYEIVMKTIRFGVPILAAVSAPTGMAVRMAERHGLTLLGFARRGRHVAYAHSQRLID